MTMHKYTFRSESRPGVTYTTLVSTDGRKRTCNCPGWTKRVAADGTRHCKHLALAGARHRAAKARRVA